VTKKADSAAARIKVLHDAGLRKTGPRLAVLGVLEQAKSPLSHADVADELDDETLDRATVYRNLMALTEAGLVRRTDLGDHVWRFELKRGEDTIKHPHFTCTDCGTVACLPEVTLSVRQGKDVPRALSKQRVEIQLRGQCDDCA
jgi:Fur family ferric uptake transcriptional regulator